ncbi:DUF2905 family protein [Heyndrickxia ginsengihumi]
MVKIYEIKFQQNSTNFYIPIFSSIILSL